MTPDYQKQTIALCAIVIAVLLCLSLIPATFISDSGLRSIDILKDVRRVDMNESTEIDSTIEADSVRAADSIQIIKANCPSGITCIEDYSADSTGIALIQKALRSSDKTSGRIAFFGDSFIEGDVLCGAFRDTLQSVFGGRGVGVVPLTSSVAGFRNTIKHDFKNWRTWSLMSRDSEVEIGPTGYTFIPLESNWVEYRGSKQRFLREFNSVKVYYRTNTSTQIHYYVDGDSTIQISDLVKSSGMREWSETLNQANSVRLEFYPADSIDLYGVSFESSTGVYVDNFAMRGNTGLSLEHVDDNLLSDFGKHRKYRLVILQFGVNLLSEKNLNKKAYVKRMVKIVQKMRIGFPAAKFLLLSVPDRSENVNGTMQTMETVPQMIALQREIAKQTGICFWDMYTAMGGYNSMRRSVEARPPLAAKDYTHLTFKGGKVIAGRLVKALLIESESRQSKSGQ